MAKETAMKLHRVGKVEMPASKRGLALMGRSGWWVNPDGTVSPKRDRKKSSR